jgi:WD40 repeat protein
MTVDDAVTRPASRVTPRENPYFGLDYYDERFGTWFFGRQDERAKVISNLQAARLTLLHAQSGVGKSSILRAGVVWRLNELASARAEDPEIPIVFSAWTHDPVAGLVKRISEAITPFTGDDPGLELATDNLADALETAARAIDGSLAVILDQFEEYFLYSSQESPPERFADELAAAINRADLPVSFLIAIREDAYAALGDLFSGRLANVYGNYLAVDYLGQEHARDAILKPLEVYNSQAGVDRVSVEPELVDAVLRQVTVRDGAGRDRARNGAPESAPPTAAQIDGRVETPLLQLAMESVWDYERQQKSLVLRESTLSMLGGATSIVDTYLGTKLAALEPAERDIGIDVLKYLVSPSGGKIAEAVPDLASRTVHGEQEIRGVLDKLRSARILRWVPAPAEQDPVRFRRYELLHDVLAPAINRAITRQEQERLRQRAEAERRHARHLKWLAAVACGVAIVAVVATVMAWIFRQHAVNETHVAQAQLVANRAASTSDLQLASLLALEAYRLAPITEASSGILTVADSHQLGAPMTGHTGWVQSVAFSPNGQLVASGSRDGTVRFWDVSSHRASGVPLAQGSVVYTVAFSPDGNMLASGGRDGVIRLWSVAERRQVGELTNGNGRRVESVAFSPDGTTLAAAGHDGAIRFWNLATRREIGAPIAGHAGIVFGVAFSPDSRTVATANDDGTIRLYSVRSHRKVGTPLRGHVGSVLSVAFSHDGPTLVSGSVDDTVRVWSVATHREIGAPLTGHTSGVSSVAVSLDGTMLASASFDGTVRLWDAATHRQIGAPLTGHTNSVESVAFDGNGSMLASGSADRTVRLWTVASPRQIGSPLIGHRSGVTSVAFSPTGSAIASGSDDRTIRLWSVPGGHQTRTAIRGAESGVSSVAFSPDGRTLASASFDHTIRLWSVATHHQIGAPMTVAHGGIESVAFSPDGRMLASGGVDHTVRLWDAATHRQIGVPLTGHNGIVYTVAFSPDGRVLASGSADGTIRLWDIAAHRQIVTINGQGSTVASVTFSHSGTMLATGNIDGTVRLWNVATHRQIGAPLTGHNDWVESVAFSHTDTTIVSGGHDGTVRVWDVATQRELGSPLVGHTASVNSVAISPDATLIASASSDGTIRLWTTYPISFYIRQLCNYVNQRDALALWKSVEPSISYRPPC